MSLAFLPKCAAASSHSKQSSSCSSSSSNRRTPSPTINQAPARHIIRSNGAHHSSGAPRRSLKCNAGRDGTSGHRVGAASLDTEERSSLGRNDAASSDTLSDALAALRRGEPVCILDAADREGETDMFFPAIGMQPHHLRLQRTEAGGELYIAVGNDVAGAFGFPFASNALAAAADTFPVLKGMSKYNGDMCQGTCSVGLSLDHRSTKTGAPDDERSYTCRRLAEMAEDALAFSPDEVQLNGEKFGKEFHVPGHVFMCTEHVGGLEARQGHTELAVAVARAAGVVPVMVGCVMLSNRGDSYGALSPSAARKWCRAAGICFLDGKEIFEALASGSIMG